MGFKALIFAACAIGCAFPAHAQQVTAQNPQSVADAMRAAGFPATLGKDATGDPKIDSSHGGSSFAVLFYNCTNNAACATVQFHAGYDLRTPVSLERINEWNRSQRFGRAYLDAQGDPIVQMDLDLDDGGISRALFTDNLEFWTSVVGRFERHIGFRQ